MVAMNIKWDTDGELVKLPNIILLPDRMGMEDVEEISNYISDLTGFCHEGFELVKIADKMYDEMLSKLELELNRKWLYNEEGDEIGETLFVVPYKWLMSIYQEHFSERYISFEEFLNVYIPEEEGEFVYQKSIEDKTIIKDIGEEKWQHIT